MSEPITVTRRRRRIVPWIIIAVVLVAALGGWHYGTHSTYHLETVQDRVLYRSGLQSFREFENAVARVKPKTIVSLIDDRELADGSKPQFKQEIETYSSGDVKVVRVPVTLGGWPQKDEVEKFLA